MNPLVADVGHTVQGASPDAPFEVWMAASVDRVERMLEALLPLADIPPVGLHAAMRYAVLGGGKRMRPLLAYAAGELGAAAPEAVDCAACAVELVHAYSLVHDDLPCMDDDTMRRGKPTVHIAFGEATAMLVGDALQSLAFAALTRACAHGVPPASAVGMVSRLARAAGSLGMAGGQAIDLDSVGKALDRAALEGMHRYKTGAMLAAAVLMGAACGPALDDTGRAALERYADAIGLAFQVVDDVLDVEKDTATLGKTAGKDAANGKPTYVSLLGLQGSKRFALQLRDEALTAIGPFGRSACRLADLADLIVRRPS